jgi:cytochrome P450
MGRKGLEKLLLHSNVSGGCRNTAAWTLFMISRYPEIEARVVAELDSLGLLASPLKPNPRELCPDELTRLPYLTAVIKETSRYHQVCMFARLTDKSGCWTLQLV